MLKTILEVREEDSYIWENNKTMEWRQPSMLRRDLT
jgi:hypothetical protein